MRVLLTRLCLTLGFAGMFSAVVPVHAAGLLGQPGQAVQAGQSDSADTTTATAINQKLVQSQLLQDQPIGVTVSGGTATLRGAVRDQASKDLATQIAQNTPGVASVNNQLTVNNAPIAPRTSENGDAGQGQVQGEGQDDDPAAANLAPVSPGDMQNQQTQQGQNANQDPNPYSSQGQAAPPQDGAAPPTNDGNSPNQNNGQEDNNAPVPPTGGPNGPRYGTHAGPNYGPQRGYAPGYRNAPPQRPVSVQTVTAGTPLTLPAGTALYVRVEQPIDSVHSQAGQSFRATVAYDVVAGGGIAIPRGTAVDGQILDAKKAGAYKGGANLALGLTTLTLGGQSYGISTDAWTREGPGKGAQTATNTVGGAAFGAIIGAIAGRGPGAAIGAVAGGAAGAASTGLERGPEVFVPAESVITFRLQTPITVTAPSNDEIRRLARNDLPMRPAGRPYPTYRRYGYYGYPGYPPPPPYYYRPYGYPYPY